MRLIIIVLGLLVMVPLQAQEQDAVVNHPMTDGPPNARPGLCYLQRYEGNTGIHWKAVLCEWKEYQSLTILRDSLEPQLSNYDEHYVRKRVRVLLDRNLAIEIRSRYASPADDTTDLCLAKARAVALGEFLIQEGLDRSQLRITVLPVVTGQNINLEIRAINAIRSK